MVVDDTDNDAMKYYRIYYWKCVKVMHIYFDNLI